MIKDYFISIEFYNRDMSKFFSSIVTFDLKKTSVQDVARTAIEDEMGTKDPSLTVKVLSLNNIS